MTVTAFLTALASVMHYVESFITIAAGFRLGLANAVGLFALLYLGPYYYVAVTFLRILIGGLFTGFGTSFLLSLAGGSLALGATLLAYRFSKTSVYGMSAIGAFFHVLGQILMYIILVQSPYMLLYFPVLAGFSLLAGLLLAVLISMLITALPPLNLLAGVRKEVGESAASEKKEEPVSGSGKGNKE